MDIAPNLMKSGSIEGGRYMSSRNYGALMAALALVAVSFGAGAYWIAVDSRRSPVFPSYLAAAENNGASPATNVGTVRRPCLNQTGREESELCAQWRAAIAGEQSAYWSWLTAILTVTGFGATLGAIALAYRANKIASSASRSQLRPYVFVEKSALFSEEKDLFIGAHIKNYGLTPAIDVEIKFQFSVAPVGSSISDGDMRTFVRSGAIAPSAISSIARKVEILNAERVAAIRRREMAIFMRCAVSYTWAGAKDERDGFDVTFVCDEPFLEQGIFRSLE